MLNEESSSVQSRSNNTCGFYSKLCILWCALKFSRINRSFFLKNDFSVKIFVLGELQIPLRYRPAVLNWNISRNCEYSTKMTSDIHCNILCFRPLFGLVTWLWRFLQNSVSKVSLEHKRSWWRTFLIPTQFRHACRRKSTVLTSFKLDFRSFISSFILWLRARRYVT